MDQIANLVIDLSLDPQKFKDEVPRIKKMLENASDKAEISAQRQKNLLELLQKQGRAYVDGSGTVFNATTRQKQALILNSQAYDQVAQRIDITQRNIEALNQKLREEQAQAAAVAQAQDAAAAAFYRQIDSVKQLSGGLQELQRIQAQIRQAKGSGNISQGDYLGLVSETTAKTRELAEAEALATQKKTQFIRSLKEQAAAQNLSRAELLRVKAAELGVSSAADVYIRKLDTATKSTHALGLKSAQARREIGVLIGELARGNFGALRGSGITLANRAGWIEQLMSPKGMMIGGVVGGIAAAVYGLGKAYYEGEKESEEFNKQLILTGSYAGKTAGQLNEMAKSIAGSGVTQHDAAGVLAQVVGSGAFSGSNVNMVARTAARMKEVVGQSVDETVSQFKRLKGDPVNAIIELNNSLHFLTAAQYQQIAAAYAQGDSERAAALAMKAYSDSTNQRLNAVKDNLGTLESAWNWVRHSASDAWDAMLGVGRKPSSAMKRQSAFTDWQVAEKNYKQLSENLKVDPDYAGSNPLTRRDAARLRDARKMVDLKKQEYEQADKVWAAEGLAAARAVTAREEQDGLIKGQQQFNNLVYAGLSPAEKRVRVEKNLNALIRQNRQAAKEGKEKLWTDADIARARAGIEKQYKDPKSPAYHNDEAGRLLLQYSGSIVNRPTFFTFARGAAVMGEAGPEAILPLRRGANGKLGVVAAGSGGMTMFAPQYHIAITNTGPELGPQALKTVYDVSKKAASDLLQQQGRDGGRLSGGISLMKTFHWKVDPDMGVDSEPQVAVVKFGDGMEQRRAAGLNNNLKKYSVTIRTKRQDAGELEDFLSEHNGVKAFLWTPPYGYRQIKVVCRKWSVKAGLLKTTFTATFEQVVV